MAKDGNKKGKGSAAKGKGKPINKWTEKDKKK